MRRRIGLSELAGRSRQAVTTWIERRIQERPARRVAIGRRPRGRPAGPAGRFFAGCEERRALDALPAIAVARILHQADRIRDGCFDLLGHEGLRFGAPIDWHLDPTTGRRAPMAHWSRLDPLHPVPRGDCKVVWELNRHQWMVRLAQAFHVSGDERYAETSEEHLRHWMASNPRGMGVNWASSLEAGLRLISWCWVLSLLSGSRVMTRGLRETLEAGIASHAAHVARHLSRWFSPNTHLTGEALALFHAGTVLPATRATARWRRIGARILDEEIGKQVLPDGAHFERSTWYHLYTLEIYLHYAILAARNGAAPDPCVRGAIARMSEYLRAVVRPDGTIPSLGDDDGGRLLPLSTEHPRLAGGVLEVAGALLGEPSGDAPIEELAWLFGTSRPEGFAQRAARSVTAEADPVRVFPDGGYAVMNADPGPGGHRLIFDVGPLGCPISGGHGHAGLLGIDCTVFGRPYLVDPGTYCYTSDVRWRDHFRSSRAHNTIVVDGEPQARPDGPFSWRERPAARLVGVTRGHRVDLVHAEHTAYTRLAEPVVHSRRVAFVDRRYWVIVDDLTGEGSHTVESRLQIAPGLEAQPGAAPWIAVRGGNDACGEAPRHAYRGLLIAHFASHPVAARTAEGMVDPIEGWVSTLFGRIQSAPQLSWVAAGPLPIRMVTILLPVTDVREAPPVTARGAAAAPLAGIALGNGPLIGIDAAAIAVGEAA